LRRTYDFDNLGPSRPGRTPRCGSQKADHYDLIPTFENRKVRIMTSYRLKQSAVIAALAFLLVYPVELRGQSLGSMMPNSAPAALTGGQQSLANKALCSALGSHVPDPASASPSALSSPVVMSTAASSFAGSTHLPLPSATGLLKGYVAQHATDILASCAISNATSGLTNKIPGTGQLPSIPKY
jgi:hypothetical protein